MVEMHEQSDVQLLRDYAEDGHEAAFRELVTRHADFVFSAALAKQKSATEKASRFTSATFLISVVDNFQVKQFNHLVPSGNLWL